MPQVDVEELEHFWVSDNVRLNRVLPIEREYHRSIRASDV